MRIRKEKPRHAAAGLLVVVALWFPGCRAAGPEAPRFAAATPGVTVDRTTTLEWTSRDHDEALPWDAADRWCRDLVLAERDDWRLPEIGELGAVYAPERDEPCGARRCRLDPAIQLRGPYVWSATARGVGTRFYFDLAYGNALSPTPSPELVRRVLCVRGAGVGAPSPLAAPRKAAR